MSRSSVLAAHRLLERGLDDWPDDRAMARAETPGPSPYDPLILHIGQRDLLLDP